MTHRSPRGQLADDSTGRLPRADHRRYDCASRVPVDPYRRVPAGYALRVAHVWPIAMGRRARRAGDLQHALRRRVREPDVFADSVVDKANRKRPFPRTLQYNLLGFGTSVLRLLGLTLTMLGRNTIRIGTKDLPLVRDPGVKYFCHAVALDSKSVKKVPYLFRQDGSLQDSEPSRQVQEVWFAGNHSGRVNNFLLFTRPA